MASVTRKCSAPCATFVVVSRCYSQTRTDSKSWSCVTLSSSAGASCFPGTSHVPMTFGVSFCRMPASVAQPNDYAALSPTLSKSRARPCGGPRTLGGRTTISKLFSTSRPASGMYSGRCTVRRMNLSTFVLASRRRAVNRYALLYVTVRLGQLRWTHALLCVCMSSLRRPKLCQTLTMSTTGTRQPRRIVTRGNYFWPADAASCTLSRLLDSQCADTPVIPTPSDASTSKRLLVCHPTLLDSSSESSETLLDSQLEPRMHEDDDKDSDEDDKDSDEDNNDSEINMDDSMFDPKRRKT